MTFLASDSVVAAIQRIVLHQGVMSSRTLFTSRMVVNPITSEYLGEPDRLIEVGGISLALIPTGKGQFTVSWEMDHGFRGSGSRTIIFKEGDNPLSYKILDNDFKLVSDVTDESASLMPEDDERYTLWVQKEMGTGKVFEITIEASDSSQIEFVGISVEAKVAGIARTYTRGQY